MKKGYIVTICRHFPPLFNGEQSNLKISTCIKHVMCARGNVNYIRTLRKSFKIKSNEGICNSFLICIKWGKLCTVKSFYVTRSLTLL